MLLTCQTTFADPQISLTLELELIRQSDLFFRSITEGFNTIGESNPDLIRHEVLLAKTQEKKLQLEESLKVMFQLDVISKFEYNKKLSGIEKNSDIIYECFARGGQDMK